MPNFRRWFVPGGSYFFTVVTERRAGIFAEESARTLLGQVYREASRQWPFHTDAIVLLPDHLHAMWSLPEGDVCYSQRWAWIKKEFTKRWLESGGSEQSVTTGRSRDGRRGVWQPKFWEHTIRDETDFESHLDYIHFNPVKHGWSRSPAEWKWSTFQRWVRAGQYDANWGTSEELDFAKLADSVGE